LRRIKGKKKESVPWGALIRVRGKGGDELYARGVGTRQLSNWTIFRRDSQKIKGAKNKGVRGVRIQGKKKVLKRLRGVGGLTSVQA